MLKWIFFDFDGTLLPSKISDYFWYKIFVGKYAKEKGISHKKAFRILRNAKVDGVEFGVSGKDKWPSYIWFNYYSWTKKLNVDWKFSEMIKNTYHLFPDRKRLLKIINQLSDYNLGIISNAQKEWVDISLKRLKLAHKFKLLVCSDTVKASKACKKIFTVALAKAKCKPEEAVYVGDSLDDLNAKEAGMKTVFLNIKNLDQINHKHYPDIIIKNLKELPKVLNKLKAQL